MWKKERHWLTRHKHKTHLSVVIDSEDSKIAERVRDEIRDTVRRFNRTSDKKISADVFISPRSEFS